MNYQEQRISKDLILDFSMILKKSKVRSKLRSKYDLNQLMTLLHNDISWNYLNRDEILFILFSLKTMIKQKSFLITIEGLEKYLELLEKIIMIIPPKRRW